jgi:copper(I)-binding protein
MNTQFMRSLAFASLVLVGLTLGACAQPTGEGSGEVNATGAWMRAVPAGAVGAIYFEIHNPGRQALHVVETRFEDAATTEMHETVQDGDIMRMLPLEDGFVVEGRGSTIFEPGGKHIMMMDLHRDMEIGATEMVTLIFEDGAELEIPVEVRDPLDLGS